MDDKKPDPLDVKLGIRLRLVRKRLGRSQGWIAERLGVTFQQIQKYEKGTNRISYSSLVKMAHAYGMTASKLIEDVDHLSDDETAEQPPEDLDHLLTQPRVADHLRVFSRMSTPLQRAATSLFEALGDMQEDTPVQH